MISILQYSFSRPNYFPAHRGWLCCDGWGSLVSAARWVMVCDNEAPGEKWVLQNFQSFKLELSCIISIPENDHLQHRSAKTSASQWKCFFDECRILVFYWSPIIGRDLLLRFSARALANCALWLMIWVLLFISHSALKLKAYITTISLEIAESRDIE